MKIDLYTKGILTVIALSLVVMAFKDVDPIRKAFADVHQQVGICHMSDTGAGQFDKLWCANVVRTRDGEALLVKIVE